MTRATSAALVLVLATACASSAARHGAAGLGDSYYPGLGNGGYDVQHYGLTLIIDPPSNHLDGVALIEAVATHELLSFHLDLWQLTVESVEVNGEAAEFQHEGLELIIAPAKTLPAGESFMVRVEYGGEPTGVPSEAMPMPEGLGGMGWMLHGENIYVVSEPNGAPSFVPCNDHPLDKATWSLRIAVPEPWVAVSNGVPEPVVDRGGRRLFVWNASDPMAPYLVTLAIAPFEVEETWLTPEFAVRNYWLPEMAEEGREGMARTADILAYFSEIFGPYPFESYGAIVTDAPIPGALETQTIPIYGKGAANESVLAHEMAHQWFGNCVAVSDWSDLWLSEGFATYASWLWAAHDQGQPVLGDRAERMASVVESGRFGSPTDPGADNLFSPGIYVGGAWVLKELHEEVGDDTFFEILRTWVERFHDGNATTEDFIALASEVSGSDQRPLLETWLYPEPPAAADG